MQARVGDRLIVSSRHVGQPSHVGEVVEVLHGVGGERYRVRWSDDRETLVMPGSDAHVERTAEPEAGQPSPRTRMITVSLRFEEDDDHCEATAMMETPQLSVSGFGRARRNPSDPVVPIIGEELAIARALCDLGDRVEQAARDAIAARESRPLHLVP